MVLIHKRGLWVIFHCINLLALSHAALKKRSFVCRFNCNNGYSVVRWPEPGWLFPWLLYEATRTCIQLDGSFHFSYLQLPAPKFELTGRPIKPLKRSTKTIFFLFYLCIIKLYLQTPCGPTGWLELTTSSVTPTKEKLIGQFSPDDRMIDNFPFTTYRPTICSALAEVWRRVDKGNHECGRILFWFFSRF